MSEIVSANNKMLEQQKADKKSITEKQVANNEAINTVIANQQTLADDAQTLTTKQAELKVAELNLAAEKATAEGEKATLLEQKAAAEAEAKAAAEAEAAYKARQTSQQQSVVASGNTSFSAQVQATSTSASASASDDEDSSYTPAPTPTPTRQRPTYSTNASSYPTGECTWGAKTLAPWAGDYWGNGAQWATSAAAAGFRTGSQPQVGAIACWNDGGYGHVAVVTAVDSTTRIQVSESNYGGDRTIGNKRGWFNPTTTSEGYVTYIYPN